jgi:hypothetical protein
MLCAFRATTEKGILTITSNRIIYQGYFLDYMQLGIILHTSADNYMSPPLSKSLHSKFT